MNDTDITNLVSVYVNQLLLALGSMFVQQTFVALGRALPAVIAPAIITDLRIDAAWVGIYFGLTAAASLVAQLGCGSFIVRHGALRMNQVSLVMVAAGTALAAVGTPPMLILSAIICGSGGSVSTPASSHLLSRVSSPRYLPLVFSIKQTAVPAGLLLAGLLGPQLTEWRDWRFTMLASAVACAAFALVLQPLRQTFDDDRVPTHTFRLSDFKSTLTSVLATPGLRALSFACLAFNGLQATVTAYFVVYLTTIGYTPVAAGFVFSVAVAVAVPGRILWGWLGSSYVSPRMMMAGLALGMAGSVALLALCSAGWPTILVGLVACALSGTALSWHGILLAETARAAPDGMRGGVTGGVLSFGQVGALALPLAYSALLDLSGSYGIGFIVCGVPPLLVGLQLLRQRSATKS
ncbi:MAG TPA: MFS transporter [Burkholderiales bacterium]|nr:MFS transporter [Burkholderiales bacterium]